MYVILLMAYGRLADCMLCAKVQRNGAWVVCEYTPVAVRFCIQCPLMHGHHPLAFTEADWGTKSGGVQRTYTVTHDCHIALHFMYTPSFMLVSICNSFMLYKSLVLLPMGIWIHCTIKSCFSDLSLWLKTFNCRLYLPQRANPAKTICVEDSTLRKWDLLILCEQ